MINDLDYIEKAAGIAAAHADREDTATYVIMSDVPNLIAELRLAREVIEACRWMYKCEANNDLMAKGNAVQDIEAHLMAYDTWTRNEKPG